MICLGALANEDVVARDVRLFGPQLTPATLEEWRSLQRSGKIKTLEIHINEGDPIPAVSYAARYSLPGTRTTDTASQLTAAVLSQTGVLKRGIEESVPSVKVFVHPCPVSVESRYLLECHEAQNYRRVMSTLAQ